MARGIDHKIIPVEDRGAAKLSRKYSKMQVMRHKIIAVENGL